MAEGEQSTFQVPAACKSLLAAVHFGPDARILRSEGNAIVPSWNHKRWNRENGVDLTPGEKAVLGQIRALYAAEARREHQLKALMMQWPPIHHEAYKRAYGGLLAKLLIQDVNAQVFSLTDTGLRAIGVAIQRPPPPQTRRAIEPKPAQETPSPDQGKGKPGALSRLFGVLRLRDSKA